MFTASLLFVGGLAFLPCHFLNADMTMTPHWDDIIYLKGKPTLMMITARTPRGVIIAPIHQPGRKTLLGNALEVTLLKDILLFGKDDEDVRLRDVYERFWAAFEKELPVHDKTPEAELRAFFEENAPMLDVERIYTSHLRKMVKWYHQLTAAGLSFPAEASEEEAKENNNADTENEPS